MITINGLVFTQGHAVNCEIKKTPITGAIYIQNQTRAWICHNNPEFIGDPAPDRFGFLYSWVFNPESLHTDVTNIKYLFSDELEYKSNFIDADIAYIIEQLIDRKKFQTCFYAKLKPFENYTEVLASTKIGYIVLRGSFSNGDRKTFKRVEIKLSRYLKKMSDAYVDFQKSKGKSVQPIFSDAEIEKIHNKFVGISSGEDFKLEFLTGQDIDRGYMSSNYAKQSGTLAKSCMSDKIEFLDIYRKNKNCSLAVLKVADLIDARCLIWEIGDVKYFDRIYYTNDWIVQTMRKKLEDSGYVSITDIEDTIEIILEENDFGKYPYIDTFRYQLEGTNRFFNQLTNKSSKGLYKCYGSTSGNFSFHEI